MKTSTLFGISILSIFALNTNDAVAQWSEIPQMQYIPVTSILAISDSTLFVGGYQHSLYRSSDVGETWVNVAGEITADTIQSLKSAGKYIFVGTNAGVYRSSDNGETWETFNAGFIWGSTSINQLASVDSVLYAATNAGAYRSTDFGTSWIAANTGLATEQGHSMTYTMPALGIVSTPAGLFATQDLLGGAYVMRPGDTTWKSIGLKTHWCIASALVALDTVIFAGTSDGVFMHNGNDTMWVPRKNGLPNNIQFCFFASTDSLLFIHVGYVGGGIYVTSDSGRVWTPIGGTVFGGASVSAIAANKKYLFAGTQGGVWRIPIANIATSVNDRPSQLPAQYTLYQNFPNPFNPSTVIRYQMPVSSRATLKVYAAYSEERSQRSWMENRARGCIR